MNKHFYLLFFSTTFLVASAFFYQNSDIKSTELEGSIVYNPSQKNEWNEKINTFLSYDGSYFSTIIIKDEDGKSHMFSSNGNIDKVAENKFEVISINKKISGNDIEIRGLREPKQN